MTDPVMLLSQVHAEGRLTYNALAEAGYETIEAIAAEDVQRLAERARLSAGTAVRLRDGARTMLRKGVDAFVATAAAGSRPRESRIAGRTSAPGTPFAAGLDRDEASLLFGPRPVIEIVAETASDPAAGPSPEPDPIEHALREDPEYAQFLPERPRDVIAAAARAAEALHAAPPGGEARADIPSASAIAGKPTGSPSTEAASARGKQEKSAAAPAPHHEETPSATSGEASAPASDRPFWSFG